MRTPDLIAAAQRISAAGRGTRPRQEFKRMLRGHQSTLSFEQWTWLLVNLVALTSTPAAVPPARTARAAAHSSGCHALAPADRL